MASVGSARSAGRRVPSPVFPVVRTSRIDSRWVTGAPACVGVGPASGGPSSPTVQDAVTSPTTTASAAILDHVMRPHRVRETDAHRYARSGRAPAVLLVR